MMPVLVQTIITPLATPPATLDSPPVRVMTTQLTLVSISVVKSDIALVAGSTVRLLIIKNTNE